MKFEITAGEVLQCLTFIIAAVAVYSKIGDRITSLETKMEVIWQLWVQQNKHQKAMGSGE